MILFLHRKDLRVNDLPAFDYILARRKPCRHVHPGSTPAAAGSVSRAQRNQFPAARGAAAGAVPRSWTAAKCIISLFPHYFSPKL
ncbi:hypothetical protein GC093_02030 [Paenibacillus sp. LMG 31456]|uniref:Uncharacterized protein n=1 Tax=Paenibacillus foliorum TaxID=2654974 RepID=A0A972GL36_9BACL|nr:hypothetical protein [Paenibacillus foliorum]NOU92015.1 hypothetical protein [Paenibacillus foliorum]